MERLKRIDYATYVTKVELSFSSRICLDLLSILWSISLYISPCLGWSSEMMSDLSGSDSRYRANEAKTRRKVRW